MDDVLTIFDNAPRSGCPAPQQVKAASWVAFCHSSSVICQGSPKQGHAMLSDEVFAGVAVGFSAGHGVGGLRP